MHVVHYHLRHLVEHGGSVAQEPVAYMRRRHHDDKGHNAYFRVGATPKVDSRPEDELTRARAEATTAPSRGRPVQLRDESTRAIVARDPSPRRLGQLLDLGQPCVLHSMDVRGWQSSTLG